MRPNIGYSVMNRGHLKKMVGTYPISDNFQKKLKGARFLQDLRSVMIGFGIGLSYVSGFDFHVVGASLSWFMKCYYSQSSTNEDESTNFLMFRFGTTRTMLNAHDRAARYRMTFCFQNLQSTSPRHCAKHKNHLEL